ncbi:hypothetical protein SynSYN20_01076 [Synechococcus sp. SYN20]|nr:hypothetical protein SynSYN20_01076 [Synechococcus sp. SYN20]
MDQQREKTGASEDHMSQDLLSKGERERLDSGDPQSRQAHATKAKARI